MFGLAPTASCAAALSVELHTSRPVQSDSLQCPLVLVIHQGVPTRYNETHAVVPLQSCIGPALKVGSMRSYSNSPHDVCGTTCAPIPACSSSAEMSSL